MGVVIPEGYAQAIMGMQLAGRPRPYGITIGVAPASPLISASAIALQLDTAVRTAGCLFDNSGTPWSNSYTYLGVNVTLMTSTGPVLGSAPRSITGGNVLQPAPPNTSLLVRKVTGRGGRKGRGRMFLPPAWVAESTINALGVIDGAVVTTMQARLTATMTAIDANDLTPVLFHEDPLLDPDEIVGLSLETQVATQRRRLRS